jgi:hypothetical protein
MCRCIGGSNVRPDQIADTSLFFSNLARMERRVSKERPDGE